MPRSTSSSARSVAAAYGRIRRRLHALDVERERRHQARHRGQGQRDLVDRVEQRRLVLLQIAVVAERQALERRQQAREVADHPARLAPRQLGDVGVLLLREHGAEPVAYASSRRGEAELVGRPEDDLLAQPRQVDRHQAQCEQRLGDEVAVADRVEAVLEPAREAEVVGRGVGVEGQRSQIFDSAGFAESAERLLAAHAELARIAPLAELNLGGGFGIAYTSADEPTPIEHIAADFARVLTSESDALGIPVPVVAIEPGRAIAGPADVTLYTVGTMKPVALDGGVRTLRVGRRRHERQHPAGALRRRRTPRASRPGGSDAAARAGAVSRASTASAGDIVRRRRVPARRRRAPATSWPCRRTGALLLVARQQLQPRAAAPPSSPSATASRA